MQARMPNPAVLLPDAMTALQALGKASVGGVPAKTLGLVHLRASQINGCGVCVDMARKHGDSVERMMLVSAWRDAPYFTAAERAALALTEAVTRIADSSDPVPDAVWAEAARHFDERALAELVLSIGVINLFNRLNVATRQIAASATW
jgi:AhpD family alkylhydroperoxidase